MWLAQIDKVQPGFLHQAALLLIGVLGGGAAVATIAGLFVKRKRQVEPQPLEVKASAEYVTEDQCRERRGEMAARIKALEAQAENLWSTMRRENTDIRAEMAQTFKDIERALGRIEGKLGTRRTHE